MNHGSEHSVEPDRHHVAFWPRFWRMVENIVPESQTGGDDRTRLLHYTVTVMLGVPTMFAFAAYNLATDRDLLGVIVALAGVGLLGGWYAISRLGRGLAVYRFNSCMFCVLLLYLVYASDQDGGRSLWTYTLPPVAIFLLGRREGLLWTLPSFAGWLFIMINPGGWIRTDAYSGSFVVRYAATISIITIVAYSFDYFRQRYRQKVLDQRLELERRNEELSRALDEIRTLRGLIPICAGCNQIRDNDGHWHRMEKYVETRTEARFSHSICPTCKKQLYPKF